MIEHKIVYIFKLMKTEPKRIWHLNDFTNSSTNNIKLPMKILKDLGLIEEVDFIYRCGRKYNSINNVAGYKLIESKNEFKSEMCECGHEKDDHCSIDSRNILNHCELCIQCKLFKLKDKRGVGVAK
jgi:hypothetical protein